MAGNSFTVDTRPLEKAIAAQAKAIERQTEYIKQTEKTLNALIRQLEKLVTTMATGNEIRRHGTGSVNA